MLPQLVSAGPDMFRRSARDPVYYEILYRDPETRRWKKAGRAATQAEALTLIGGPGDWHLKPVFADRGEPTLFDDVEGDRPCPQMSGPEQEFGRLDRSCAVCALVAPPVANGVATDLENSDTPLSQ